MSWDKKIIRNYILASIILIAIPVATFFLIDLYLISIGIPPLDPILYVISSITGLSTIYFRITMDIIYSNTHRAVKAFFIILMFTSPFIGYFGFGFVSPVPITIDAFARAMFGYVFGATVGTAYELMKPRKT